MGLKCIHCGRMIKKPADAILHGTHCAQAPSTKHLDTAIAILKGTPAAKRAPRKAQVTITVETGVDKESGERAYTLQANGKTIEEGLGSDEYAYQRAEERAARIRGHLGKTVVIV